MKYLLPLLLTCTIAAAEPFGATLEIGCDRTDIIMESLKSSKYKERMRWSGQMPSDLSFFSLWVNESTQAWTLLKSSTSGHSCVVGAGTESTEAERETI